jgi:hypothetical protein
MERCLIITMVIKIVKGIKNEDIKNEMLPFTVLDLRV